MRLNIRVARITAIVTLGCVLMTGVTTGASTPKVSTELLGLKDMPAAWTVASDRGDTGVGCLTKLLEPKGFVETQYSQAYFRGPAVIPVFDEVLTTYNNTKGAYSKIIATINKCRLVRGTFKGYAVEGKVVRIAFSHYGNASSTYAMALTTGSLTMYYDYALVRKGNVVAALLEGTTPRVNATQFRGLIVKALAKIKS